MKISNKVFLSPHFDDLAFSLSGHLLDWREGFLVNIFSVCNRVTSKYKSQNPMHYDVTSVSKIRDAEDILFCNQFYLNRFNLEMSEATVRGEHHFNLNGLEPLKNELSNILIPFLLQLVEADQQAKLALYCPMGIGGHIDHLATLQVVIGNYQVLRQFFDIYFYEEFPYASSKLIRKTGLINFYSCFENAQYRNFVKQLNTAEVEAKIDLISIYQSQLSTLVKSTFIPCESIWHVENRLI